MIKLLIFCITAPIITIIYLCLTAKKRDAQKWLDRIKEKL